MKNLRNITICCLLVLLVAALSGCGSKADEDKPISDVKAEAEKMDVDQLRDVAMQYKDALVAKKADVAEITAKLKEIPITEIMGEEAKNIKAEIDNLNKSASALKERFQVYYNNLKAKDGDLSGLKI